MTKVKICGITNLEDASLAVKFGADAVGFNFFPGSKRHVDEGSAACIVESLAEPITKVGVFVNPSVDDVLDAISIADLDVIQLHGDETPKFVSLLKSRTDAKVIKAFRVNSELVENMIKDYNVDAIMLDSYSINDRGGTGKVFDWTVAARIAGIPVQLYLAGGLTPENVGDAVRLVRPYCVDVASGVESVPGKKDRKKLEAFIRNAKSV